MIIELVREKRYGFDFYYTRQNGIIIVSSASSDETDARNKFNQVVETAKSYPKPTYEILESVIK
jgi:hypothetical protein